MITASRTHEICCGHRVVNQGGKCEHLHGHNYVIEFSIKPYIFDPKDGRVLDFSIIKDTLCEWLETNWDHRFLVWDKDPWKEALKKIDSTVTEVPFNPTAENIAYYLYTVVCPEKLAGRGVYCSSVVVHETGKCQAQVNNL